MRVYVVEASSWSHVLEAEELGIGEVVELAACPGLVAAGRTPTECPFEFTGSAVEIFGERNPEPTEAEDLRDLLEALPAAVKNQLPAGVEDRIRARADRSGRLRNR